ncbi:MAG: hypothetical protein C0467_19955 [Planctomycetaceae bacterium]|nr:hypothetical protein [Planctomycetaceae bacterium]
MPPKKPAKKQTATKKAALTDKQQEALDELREDEQKNEASKLAIQQRKAKEAAIRKGFDEDDEKKIETALEKCASHLRGLNDTRLAREVHRRLLGRINNATKPRKI